LLSDDGDGGGGDTAWVDELELDVLSPDGRLSVSLSPVLFDIDIDIDIGMLRIAR
jgi:hypothetical protein